MNKFTKVSRILDEFSNCAAGITGAYESLPTRTKDYKAKKDYESEN